MSEENKTNAMEEKPESVQPEEPKVEDKKETSMDKPDKKERKKDKKKKQDEELKGLSMKERKKVLEERKEKRRRKWYIAIGIVVVVLVAGLLFFDSGVLQRNLPALKVGDKSYSAAELDYYYYSGYNSYSTYAAYYGLDTSKSLKDQEIYSGTTWYDYFRDNAKNTLTNVSVLIQEAEKAGYSLSEEGQKTVEEHLQELKDACKENGYSVDYYLNATYGEYMNYNTYKKVITDNQLALEYEDKMKESFEQSDEDVDAYYKEHAAELDTFAYQAYLVPVNTETKTDDEGNTEEPTEEEIKDAEAKAKEGAEALKAALTEDNKDQVAELVEEYGASDYSDQTYDSFSGYDFSDWLTDKDRKAGDVTSIKYETEDSEEETTLNGYYVVRFEKRYLDEYRNASFRNILVTAEAVTDENDETVTDEDGVAVYDYDEAKKTAEELQEKWQKAGGDSDAFAELTEENSGDSTSSANGGLYENVSKTDVSEALKSWLFDEKRKEGDYTILKDEDNTGYQLVYFEGYSEKYHWQDVSIDALQDEAYNDWYDGVAEDYKDSTTFMYRFV